jgi:hypothetical protein
MPENRHGHPWVHVEVSQQRTTGTPGIMHRDLPNAGLQAPRVPRAVEVAGIDWRAGRGVKDQAGVLPGGANCRLRGIGLRQTLTAGYLPGVPRGAVAAEPYGEKGV